MTVTLHQIAQDARLNILHAVEDGAKSLLLTPGLGNGTEKVVQALADALDSYEALVRSAHHSSTEQWALRDLPFDEKPSYNNAKHLLSQLRTLHALNSEA